MGWPTRNTIVLRSPSLELQIWYLIYQLALSGTVSVSTAFGYLSHAGTQTSSNLTPLIWACFQCSYVYVASLLNGYLCYLIPLFPCLHRCSADRWPGGPGWPNMCTYISSIRSVDCSVRFWWDSTTFIIF
jgi:hypothetical protein